MTEIMSAKLAYLTSPQSGRYVLNLQPEGSAGVLRYEITKAQLGNIIVDGAAMALRERP